jgi:hypothetical protein
LKGRRGRYMDYKEQKYIKEKGRCIKQEMEEKMTIHQRKIHSIPRVHRGGGCRVVTPPNHQKLKFKKKTDFEDIMVSKFYVISPSAKSSH